MLKPYRANCPETLRNQPPSGGCVLKHQSGGRVKLGIIQPPSGGCVLKLIWVNFTLLHPQPAAFRRLCVET